MKIENQLNKVKTSKRVEDITAKIAVQIIDAILKEENECISTLSAAVFGSKSGMLVIGLGLLSPQFLVAITTKLDNEIMVDNLKLFKIPCDVIQTYKIPCLDRSIDISVVGPQLNKSKKTDLSEINMALAMSKKTYCCFSSDQEHILKEKYSNAKEIVKIPMNITQSLNYHKESQNIKDFKVFVIAN